MFVDRLRRYGWIVLVLVGCDILPPPPPPKTRTAPPLAKPESPEPKSKASAVPRGPDSAPDHFQVGFETSKGDFVVDVHRHWSPLGADQFYKLVKLGYYDNCKFFRVVPGFVVQWGVSGDPAMNQKYLEKTIPDDQPGKSNIRGRITFAKSDAPNSRSTQLFINLKDNSELDSRGFPPFGEVIEGMDEVVAQITSEYGEQPHQGTLAQAGNAYLDDRFPNLDYIIKARVLGPDGKPEPDKPAEPSENQDSPAGPKDSESEDGQ